MKGRAQGDVVMVCAARLRAALPVPLTVAPALCVAMALVPVWKPAPPAKRIAASVPIAEMAIVVLSLA